MANIKVKELETLVKQFNDANTFTYGELEIEIKQYLPIEKKKEIIEDVVYRCLAQTEDKVQLIHSYLSDIPKTTAIVRQYTNINLPEDNYKAYNLIRKTKLDEFVLMKIPQSEIEEIDKMINRFIEDLRFNQMHSVSVETILTRALDRLIAKIPTEDGIEEFVKKIGNEIKNFDPSKMEYVNQFMAINRGENIG
ncbi:hypothetical protein ACR77J_08110 [Tissierella praeacuta]|uniref:hypothetical protein n=1 Tax=Tissierella praeacuta TaxID=43131 RepID=UPI003DA58F94